MTASHTLIGTKQGVEILVSVIVSGSSFNEIGLNIRAIASVALFSIASEPFIPPGFWHALVLLYRYIKIGIQVLIQ